jgi:DNA-binding FadR family transcriptional regulator
MLNGIASARASALRPASLITQLGTLVSGMAETAGSGDPAEFENLVWEFRRAVNQEVAGPRLRAAISSFQGFMPTAFWLGCADRAQYMLPTYRAELDAIERGAAEEARQVVVRRAARMAETVIDELYRRGVFDPGEEPRHPCHPSTGRIPDHA